MKDLLVLTAVALLLVSQGGCYRNSRKSTAVTDAQPATDSESPKERARKEAQASIDRGNDLYLNDQDQEAAEAYQQAVSLDPDFAEAHFRLGLAYSALGEKQEAEASYKRAVDLYKRSVQADPKDAEAFFNLAESCSYLHRYEEAVTAYRVAVHLRPDDAEAFYRLGMALNKLARYTEASAAFQKAMDLDPSYYRAGDALETAREGSRRIQEAKKHQEEMREKEQDEQNNGNANSNTPQDRTKNGKEQTDSGSRPTVKRSPSN
jgi:tetratricopeptide (TPR) repeat protein